MQFLEIGAPCDVSDCEYLNRITHDEDRILFGVPYGTPGEVALQRLVSTLKKQEGKYEATRVERDMYELMELVEDCDDKYDRRAYKASTKRKELRLARLRKESVDSEWHQVGDPCGNALFGLFLSDKLLYNETCDRLRQRWE
jgi:hypothetical protein